MNSYNQQFADSSGNSRTIDVQSFIDGRKMSRFQITIAIICIAVLVLDGFDSGMIAYVAPALATELHLLPAQMGPLFAAGLAGLTIGAFVGVAVADRIGRKKVLLGTVAMFGGFTLLALLFRDFSSIVALRFGVGLGLGGAGPVAMALIAETCPFSKRSRLLAYLGCGIPVGGIIAGAVATRLIPTHGWHSMFIVGGGLPILLLLAIAFRVPESVRFLLLRRGGQERVRQIIQKMAPDQNLADAHFWVKQVVKASRAPMVDLFHTAPPASTAFLWLASFSTMIVISFVSNWLPILLQSAHRLMSETSLLLSLFLFGSPCGSLLIGVLMDKYNRYVCLFTSALIGALGLVAIGNIVGQTLPTGLIIAVLGAACGACFTGAGILASFIYPTSVRATGIGWTIGCGRLGSVLGSMTGTFFLSLGVSLPSLLKIASVPCFVAFGAFVGMFLIARKRTELTTLAEFP
ncbi:MFS transporter [Burkholderia multivorans]|uniref:MFS transporter n=1 Tax=Burkholderia multivorans TaxID=87883 RepID=UPI00201856A7|nr:MFS transporter [Burkholderia multivorans]MCO1368659.1 MFS transporter [Burkholderia multivorans]MCO1380550.1 MFS transporter [Burkholderia multivorans]MDN8032085.1 MFS transporter [Burkholderia multivorans]UQP22023.1 MFS transporter [Burkholderia multivorans]UQP91529.1 MFS transporter [Burkholderia multivorans]